MIPAAFESDRRTTLDGAVGLLTRPEDAKVLAGGHSLLPAMKLRLAQPKTIVDVGRIADLHYIPEQNGVIAIGAMTTHFDIESSPLLKDKLPPPPHLPFHLRDFQVQN